MPIDQIIAWVALAIMVLAIGWLIFSPRFAHTRAQTWLRRRRKAEATEDDASYFPNQQRVFDIPGEEQFFPELENQLMEAVKRLPRERTKRPRGRASVTKRCCQHGRRTRTPAAKRRH